MSFYSFSGNSPPDDTLDKGDLDLLISVFRTLKEWRDSDFVNKAQTDALEPKDTGNNNDNKSK